MAISLGDVNVELGNNRTDEISMNSAAVRGLFKQASGEMKIAFHGRGKSNAAEFTVTGTNVDFDLKTYMDANSIEIMSTINVTFSGTFGGSNADNPRYKAPSAITIASFDANTVFNIINTGTIKGGSGRGAEGYCDWRKGGHGGNGITLDGAYTVTVDNGSGTIYGAGGGGGGNSNGGSYGLCKYGGNGEGYARGSSGGAGGSHGGNGGQSGGGWGEAGGTYGAPHDAGAAGYYVQALNGATVSFSSNGTLLGTAP